MVVLIDLWEALLKDKLFKNGLYYKNAQDKLAYEKVQNALQKIALSIGVLHKTNWAVH